MHGPSHLGPAIRREQPGRRETGDRRIYRQDIMRQLGKDQLEGDPGRQDPAQAKPHRRSSPPRPYEGHGRGGEQRPRPKGQQESGKIITGRRAVGLLAGRDLAEPVVTAGRREEVAVAGDSDRDEPRQYDEEHQRYAPAGRSHRSQPTRRPMIASNSMAPKTT